MDKTKLEVKLLKLVSKLAEQNVHLEAFDHKDIHYGTMLSKGGEAIVQRCTVMYKGLPVEAAVKTVYNNSDESLAITLDDIELLCSAKGHIIVTAVTVYGVAVVPENNQPNVGHLAVITEPILMNALELYEDQGPYIPLHVTYDLWSNIAAALHCLHCKHIILNDLKPENVLVTEIRHDVSGVMTKIHIKIIDLGMGRRLLYECSGGKEIRDESGFCTPDKGYDVRANYLMLAVTFCSMLLPPSLLHQAALLSLRKEIRETSQQGVYGCRLYHSVVEPRLMSEPFMGRPYSEIQQPIRNMLCSLLESSEHLKITLPDVVTICREEATFVAKQSSDSKQLVTCPVTDSCTDSSTNDGVATVTKSRTMSLSENISVTIVTVPGKRKNEDEDITQDKPVKLQFCHSGTGAMIVNKVKHVTAVPTLDAATAAIEPAVPVTQPNPPAIVDQVLYSGGVGRVLQSNESHKDVEFNKANPMPGEAGGQK